MEGSVDEIYVFNATSSGRRKNEQILRPKEAVKAGTPYKRQGGAHILE